MVQCLRNYLGDDIDLIGDGRVDMPVSEIKKREIN